MKTETNSTNQESNTTIEQPERLLTVLHSLENLIERQTSLRFAFVRGIVYGFGTVIGATVLVALFGGVIAATINTFSDEPVLTEQLDLTGPDESSR